MNGGSNQNPFPRLKHYRPGTIAPQENHATESLAACLVLSQEFRRWFLSFLLGADNSDRKFTDDYTVVTQERTDFGILDLEAMKNEFNIIVAMLSSDDLKIARDGAVKVMLIFEAAENGFLDKATAALFPDAAFNCGYSDDDIDELARSVASLIEGQSLHVEIRSSLIWALTKLYRQDVLRFFIDLTCQSRDVKNLCENTDVLNYVANYVLKGIPDPAVSNIVRLREVLRDVEFSDAELRESKCLIMG